MAFLVATMTQGGLVSLYKASLSGRQLTPAPSNPPRSESPGSSSYSSGSGSFSSNIVPQHQCSGGQGKKA